MKLRIFSFSRKLIFRITPQLRVLSGYLPISKKTKNKFYGALIGLDIGRDSRVIFKQLKSTQKYKNQMLNVQKYPEVVAIDVQGLTGPDLYRGLGRYTIKIIKELAARNPNTAILCFLTNAATNNSIKRVFDAIENSETKNIFIEIIDLFGQSEISSVENAREEIAKHLIKLRVKKLIIPNFFLIDLHMICLGKINGIKTYGILHDLIPLEFQDIYLLDQNRKEMYFASLKQLESVDLIMSISNFSAARFQALVNPDRDIKVIGGSGFHKNTSEIIDFHHRKGVLCVGGLGEVKNIKPLIIAYSKLPEETMEKHPLTIIGLSSTAERLKLSLLARRLKGNIKLKGVVSEASLMNYYKKSRVLVVPSLAEGMSMPVFEMWAQGGIAIGGRNTALEETIASDELLFDVENFVDFADVLLPLLENEQLWLERQTNAQEQLKIKSWARVAKKLEEVLWDEF